MGNRIFTPIRKYSTDAASDFENESLDVVFIDMSHEYKDVKLDIETWLPKVKRSGHLAGHDASWPGVKRAIEEKFLHTNNLYTSPGDCWLYHNI
jgi:predicted O-methyltransferase YrrM